MAAATRSFETGHTARDVARLMGITVAQVRAWVRQGFLSPRQGSRGEYRFSLQDLVLLRTAKELSAHVPPRKVKRALARLREQLPSGRPLTAVRITAEGDSIVVRDGADRWEPESGQARFDFGVGEIVSQVAPLLRKVADDAESRPAGMSAEGWFDLGCELETAAPDRAMAAYRRAIEIAPDHAPARVNLGRLLHEAGDRAAAEREYRQALAANPKEAIAAFNLGVVLEDLGRPREAIAAYEQAIAADSLHADAHFNASRLYEAIGDKTSAFRHLKAYRQITSPR
jgi:tetratricopeptide (TPR) repeat protein